MTAENRGSTPRWQPRAAPDSRQQDDSSRSPGIAPPTRPSNASPDVSNIRGPAPVPACAPSTPSSGEPLNSLGVSSTDVCGNFGEATEPATRGLGGARNSGRPCRAHGRTGDARLRPGKQALPGFGVRSHRGSTGWARHTFWGGNVPSFWSQGGEQRRGILGLQGSARLQS